MLREVDAAQSRDVPRAFRSGLQAACKGEISDDLYSALCQVIKEARPDAEEHLWSVYRTSSELRAELSQVRKRTLALKNELIRVCARIEASKVCANQLAQFTAIPEEPCEPLEENVFLLDRIVLALDCELEYNKARGRSTLHARFSWFAERVDEVLQRHGLKLHRGEKGKEFFMLCLKAAGFEMKSRTGREFGTWTVDGILKGHTKRRNKRED